MVSGTLGDTGGISMGSTQQAILITGAASGIGQELCRLFARRGAKIGLVDRKKGQLDAFAEEIYQAGGAWAAGVVDVSQREEVQGAVRQIISALGPPDILIPCAGICRAPTVDNLRISELEEILSVNFLGMVYTIE